MKIQAFFLSIFSIYAVSAMDQNQYSCNKYKNQVIDTTSLYPLSEKLPSDVQSVVTTWAEKNKEMLQRIVPTADNVVVTGDLVKVEKERSDKILTDAGIKSLSRSSYVFELPEKIAGKKYFVQIAGPILKRMNLVLYNGFGWHNHRDITEQCKRMDTYQTVSRLANYLLCKEKIDELSKNGKVRFKVPGTYVFQIPGRKDNQTNCCDENSFILQEAIEDAVNVRERKEINGDKEITIASKKIENITSEMMDHTMKVIVHSGMWDSCPNLLIDDSAGLLLQSDLEQPLDANPADFFNKNPKKFWSNVFLGMSGFSTLLQAGLNQGYDVKERCMQMSDFIKNNLALQQSPEVDNLNRIQFKYE